MKSLMSFVVLALLSVSVQASAYSETFCRTMSGNGVLGQPPGPIKTTQCVSFANNKVSDTIAQASGNPPAPAQYYQLLTLANGNQAVLVQPNGEGGRWKQIYEISADGNSLTTGVGPKFDRLQRAY